MKPLSDVHAGMQMAGVPESTMIDWATRFLALGFKVSLAVAWFSCHPPLSLWATGGTRRRAGVSPSHADAATQGGQERQGPQECVCWQRAVTQRRTLTST